MGSRIPTKSALAQPQLDGDGRNRGWDDEGDWDSWQWDGDWWDKEAERGTSKASNSPPRRRRGAASSGSAGGSAPSTWPAEGPEEMAMLRGLLQVPGKDADGMQALPASTATNVQQYAMTMNDGELPALYASFARFVSLLIAEINAAIVAANRKKWTLPAPSKDRDKNAKDRDREDDGEDDKTCLMQTAATPGYNALLRLQKEMEELNPRLRATRAFALLQQLQSSAYATLGRQHTGPFLASLEELLLSHDPVEALHYDDQERAWCEITWKGVKKTLDNILLATAPTQPSSSTGWLPNALTSTSDAAASSVCMVVRDGQGNQLGGWQVQVQEAAPVVVDIAYGTGAASTDEYLLPTGALAGSVAMTDHSSTSISIQPFMDDCHYHMWHIGVMSDVQVVAKYGIAGVNAFRSRASEEIEGDGDVCSGSEVTAEEANEIEDEHVDSELH